MILPPNINILVLDKCKTFLEGRKEFKLWATDDGELMPDTRTDTCMWAVYVGDKIKGCKAPVIHYKTKTKWTKHEDGRWTARLEIVASVKKKVLWRSEVIDHTEWAERVRDYENGIRTDITLGRIPWEVVLKTRRDAGAMSRSIWLGNQCTGTEEEYIGSEWNEFGTQEQRPCKKMNVVDGKTVYSPCQHHGVYWTFMKAMEVFDCKRTGHLCPFFTEEQRDEYVASKIWRYFIWPRKPHEIPLPLSNWSKDDFYRAQEMLYRRLKYNLRKHPDWDADTAHRKAFGFLYHKVEGFRENFKPTERILKNVALSSEDLRDIKREVFLILRRHGIKVPGRVPTPEKMRNILQIYRQCSNVRTVNCPKVIDPGEGCLAANIINFMAVDQLGREWVEHPEDKKVVVTLKDGSTMDAVAFNKATKAQRKALLGCVCDTCWQEEAFKEMTNLKGRRIQGLIIDDLNDSELAAAVSNFANTLEGADKGRDAIDGMEKDIQRTSAEIIYEAITNQGREKHKPNKWDAYLKNGEVDEIEVGDYWEDDWEYFDHMFGNSSQVIDDMFKQHLRDVMTIGVKAIEIMWDNSEGEEFPRTIFEKVYGKAPLKCYTVVKEEYEKYMLEDDKDWYEVRKRFLRIESGARRALESKKLLLNNPYIAREFKLFKPALMSWEKRESIIELIDMLMAEWRAEFEAGQKEHKKYMKEKCHLSDEEEKLFLDYTGKPIPKYTLWSQYLQSQELKRKKTYKPYTVDEFFTMFPGDIKSRR